MSEILLKRISELCESKNISRRELQRALNLSSSTVTKWKTSAPKPETLQKVANYFDVTVDYLTGKSPYMNQDHMFKCWEEQYGDSENRPDIMLTDGTIVEFMGAGNTVTLHSTGGHVDYTYIDPETRQLAEKIMNDDQLRHMVEHLTNLSQKKINVLYDLLRVMAEEQ